MGGQALHTSKTRTASTGGRFGSSLELFAGVYVLQPDPSDDTLTGLVARARSEAETAVLSGRVAATVDIEFARLYQIARAQAATAKPAPLRPEAQTRWERVFSALGTLRHRQRAGLALYYLAGLPLAGVARCLTLSEADTRKVLESGIAAVVRQLGEPADVRRSLRTAGARLIEPAAAPGPEPRIEPARLPRSVVRTLLAPPPTVDALGGRAIEDTLLPPPPEPAVIPIRTSSPSGGDLRPYTAPILTQKARRGRASSRLILAAAVAVLLGAAFVPAVARDRAPVARPIKVVQAHAPKLAAPARATALPMLALVRSGDSLWAIAQRELHDPMRWPEIWTLNRNQTFGARTFSNPDLIYPGWRLRLPKR